MGEERAHILGARDGVGRRWSVVEQDEVVAMVRSQMSGEQLAIAVQEPSSLDHQHHENKCTAPSQPIETQAENSAAKRRGYLQCRAWQVNSRAAVCLMLVWCELMVARLQSMQECRSHKFKCTFPVKRVVLGTMTVLGEREAGFSGDEEFTTLNVYVG